MIRPEVTNRKVIGDQTLARGLRELRARYSL